MKKSAKVSLALALMMGVVGGAQIASMNTASAEISDKFKMEMNGVISYKSVNDTSSLDSYAPTKTNGRTANHYWSNYYRVVLNYYQDKNVSAQFRIHSGYDTAGDFIRNTNYYVNPYYNKDSSSNYNGKMFMDRAYVQLKDPVAKATYKVGKMGSYLGQGMVFNSTGNHTGVMASLGNWWEPNKVDFFWWDNTSGKTERGINAHVGVAKNVTLSALYIATRNGKAPATSIELTKDNQKALKKLIDQGKGYVKNSYYTSYQEANYKSKILAIGAQAKLPAVTLVGEVAHNMEGSNVQKGQSGNRKAWYLEAYTGPTSDMTSGLPLQKPGTSVWSLKYQDIGYQGTTGSHNPTFIDNVRGFRLTYGHTFRKGLAGDIAWGRYKEKFTNKSKNSWDNIIVGEISFKFK